MSTRQDEDYPKLNARGGTLILKSISLFLARAGGRSSKQPNKSTNSKCKKKMSVKDVKCPSKIFEFARNETHFTRSEIEALFKVYKKLIAMGRPNKVGEKMNGTRTSSAIGKPPIVKEGLDRIIFQELLHNTFDLITEDMLIDRIYVVWDESNVGLLTPEAWFKGLSIFLKGTLQEKVDFCFSVYDLNLDGYITKDEIFQLLKNCLIKQPMDEDPDEGVKDLVEIVMRKLDKDKDGKISLDDYRKSIEDEPLLLEAFGRCLPDERACETFLSTVKI